jgi:pyridoxal biosynthesis lyase PdxS
MLAVNGLLEATDVKFKDELALLVPIERWQRAASLARTKGRNATKEVSELSGMIKLRNEDLKTLHLQRDEALQKTESLRLAFEEARQSASVKFNDCHQRQANMI